MHLLILAILIVFLIYAGLMAYYRNAWQRVSKQTFTHISRQATIALIIPARNEAHQLPKLLQSIAELQYPKELLEVVVVDDHSTDDTLMIASRFTAFNLQAIPLARYVSSPINAYKKKAIEIGIAATQSQLIVTTDADCIVPPDWLNEINACYQQHQAQMIIMPVMFFPEKSALDVFQSLDFMVLQGITGAAIQKNIHAMCNGANLCYTRAAYNAVNGFEGIDAIASGDDMLLLQKISRQFPHSIRYIKKTEAVVQTSAMPNVISFIQQRIRWASKAGHYREPKIISIMLLVFAINLCLLLFPFLYLHTKAVMGLSIFYWYVILWIIKITAELYFLSPVAAFFKKKNILRYFIPAQPFHVLYTLLSGTLGWFATYDWKGRKVK